ncbi:hypothetical protein CMI48_00075 [Candidatus Pacearchaeota archaeon]|nr:hypothetical protein [Candidatus Pacearchaeota archaeon]|tara:strand:- start:148 stop:363 length:216 start_codon:yes stop_codon:yes gene_type:complete
MPKKTKPSSEKVKCSTRSCGKGGCYYGLGFIGSAIYFIQTSTGFWMGVLGVLKALVWPAYVIYGLLKFLGL